MISQVEGNSEKQPLTGSYMLQNAPFNISLVLQSRATGKILAHAYNNAQTAVTSTDFTVEYGKPSAHFRRKCPLYSQLTEHSWLTFLINRNAGSQAYGKAFYWGGGKICPG